MTVEAPVLTPEERRIHLIDEVRRRISTNPDTVVSFRVGDPDDKTYKLVSRDEGSSETRSITVGSTSVLLEAYNLRWGTNIETRIDLHPNYQFYLSYSRKKRLHDEEAIEEAEKDIAERFLPAETQPAAA